MNDEPEREVALNILENADNLKMAGGSLMEVTVIVQSRFGEAGLDELDIIIASANIQCVASTEEHARLTRTAFKRYGKGQNNRAQLNFGDCFAYALAKDTGETLLFKGDDFIHTDLKLMRLDS